MPLAIQACLMALTALTVAASADEPTPQPLADTAQRYIVDASRTQVSFEVRSLGIFKQRGWFGRSSGVVTLDPQASRGTFDVVIDATTVQASSAARLRIIRGAGFLNVEQFRAISYKSEQVAFSDGKPSRVDGELTLLGVTHPVPLRVSAYQCAASVEGRPQRCTMDASAVFRRSDFGMTGSTPLAGDRIRLTIHAEATPEAIAEQHE